MKLGKRKYPWLNDENDAIDSLIRLSKRLKEDDQSNQTSNKFAQHSYLNHFIQFENPIEPTINNLLNLPILPGQLIQENITDPFSQLILPNFDNIFNNNNTIHENQKHSWSQLINGFNNIDSLLPSLTIINRDRSSIPCLEPKIIMSKRENDVIFGNQSEQATFFLQTFPLVEPKMKILEAAEISISLKDRANNNKGLAISFDENNSITLHQHIFEPKNDTPIKKIRYQLDNRTFTLAISEGGKLVLVVQNKRCEAYKTKEIILLLILIAPHIYTTQEDIDKVYLSDLSDNLDNNNLDNNNSINNSINNNLDNNNLDNNNSDNNNLMQIDNLSTILDINKLHWCDLNNNKYPREYVHCLATTTFLYGTIQPLFGRFSIPANTILDRLGNSVGAATEYSVRIWNRRDLKPYSRISYNDKILKLEENIYHLNKIEFDRKHGSCLANVGDFNLLMYQTKRCEHGKVAEMNILVVLVTPLKLIDAITYYLLSKTIESQLLSESIEHIQHSTSIRKNFESLLQSLQ